MSIFSSTKSILVLSTARMQYAICLQISQYGTRYTKAIVHEYINPLSRLQLRSEELPPHFNSSNVIDDFGCL